MTTENKPLISVTVPVATKNRTNQRVHWATKARETKKERSATALMLRTTGLQTQPRFVFAGGKQRRVDSVIGMPLPLTVTLTRLAPRALDDDGNVAALKAIRDEVAAWIGVDDRDPRVTWKCAQEKCAAKDVGVRIVVSVDDVARVVGGGV